MLGFLRNESEAHQRHKRSVSSSRSQTGKILVSFTTYTSSTETECYGRLMCLHLVFSTFPAAVQNCTNISCLRIMCLVGRLDRRESAVVKIRSRLWAQTFLRVSISSPVNIQILCYYDMMLHFIHAGSLPRFNTSVDY